LPEAKREYSIREKPRLVCGHRQTRSSPRRGNNHRFGLFDMVLVKNNHIDYAGSLSRAWISRARRAQFEIEIEAARFEEMEEALFLGVERILLDKVA